MPDLFSMEQGSRQSSQITGDATGDVSAGTLQAQIAELASEKQARSEKGQANGYASLGSDSKVPAAQMPSISLGEYKGSVADEAAMIALTAEPGDTCLRSDFDPDRVYLLLASPASTASNWASVTGYVVSVNGETGAVSLSAADVGAATTAQGATADAAIPKATGTAADQVLTFTASATPIATQLTTNTVLAKRGAGVVANAIGVAASTDLLDRDGGDGRYDPAGTSSTHANLTSAHGSTALNTAGAIVQRDGSGGFAAGIATLTGETITLPAAGQALVDGDTTPRTADSPTPLKVSYGAGVDNGAAVEIDVIGGGFVSHAIHAQIQTGAIAAGDDGGGLMVFIDKSQATGGHVDGLHVTVSRGNGADVSAVHTGAGVAPIHQVSGAEVALTVFLYNGAYTDITADVASAASDVTLFAADNDQAYIGFASSFGEIKVALATVASNAGIKPVFEFWNGAAWTEFSPMDGTRGFRFSGSISFTASSLTGWADVAVNGTTKRWIRITRTANTLATPPVEDTIVGVVGIEYSWDASGNITGRQFTSTVATGTAPGVVASTTLVTNLNADKVDGADASATPTANTIPIADSGGKLAAGWGGSASTLATLDSSSKVVQDPANATTTAATAKIPIALTGGQLAQGWIGSNAGGLGRALIDLGDGTSKYVPITGSAGVTVSATASGISVSGSSGGSTTSLYSASGISLTTTEWHRAQVVGSTDALQTVTNVYQSSSVSSTYDASELVSDTALLTRNSRVEMDPDVGDTYVSRIVATATASLLDYCPIQWSVAEGSISASGAELVFNGSTCITSSDSRLTTLITGTGDWTIEGWIQGTPGNSVFGSQAIANAASNSAWAIIFGATTPNKLELYLSTSGSAWTSAPLLTSTTSVNDGVRRHFAIVRNGGTMRLYISGVQEASAAYAGSIFASTRVWSWGGFSDLTGNCTVNAHTRVSDSCLYPSGTGFTPADPLVGPTWPSIGYGYSSLALSASELANLAAITLTETTPNGATVRYALSFDNGATFETYNGSAWSAIAIADIPASGMTGANIQTYLAQIETEAQAGGAVSRVAYGMTSVGGYAPTVDPSVGVDSTLYTALIPGTDFIRRVSGGAVLLQAVGSTKSSCFIRIFG